MMLNKLFYFVWRNAWEEVSSNSWIFVLNPALRLPAKVLVLVRLPWAKNNKLFYQKMGPFPLLIFGLGSEQKERFLVVTQDLNNYILMRVDRCQIRIGMTT